MNIMKTFVLAACAALALQGLANPIPVDRSRPRGRPSAGAHRAPGKGGRHKVGPVVQRERDRMSREDRRLVDRIEEADGFRDIERLYPHARASRNPYVRAALVDALEEHGERAVNLLAALVADPDEDVADAAFSSWSNIVEDIPWRRRAAVLVEAAAAIQQPAVALPPPVPVQPAVVPAGEPVPVAPVTTVPTVSAF